MSHEGHRDEPRRRNQRREVCGVRWWEDGVQRRRQIDAAVDPGIVVEMLFGPLFHRWLLRTAPLDDTYADAVAAHVVRAIQPGA